MHCSLTFLQLHITDWELVGLFSFRVSKATKQKFGII